MLRGFKKIELKTNFFLSQVDWKFMANLRLIEKNRREKFSEK